MSVPLHNPRLPEGEVSLVLIAGESPWLETALKKRGIATLVTQRDARLPEPVGVHPDLQVCPLPDKHMFVSFGNPQSGLLEQLGYTVTQAQSPLGNTYPEDVRCGGMVMGGSLVGNPKGLDPKLMAMAAELGLELLPVRQGYTACSIALVDSHSAITGDPGLYRALTAKGFQALQIRPGFLRLPGYDTGFLGGCCGKLAPDKLAFTGRLDCHPDGERIRAFLKSKGVTAVELTDGPLVDVGGILPLLEKAP